jgi:hypothetical protein
MEINFWQSVGINPYYMYIDDTINLVDESRVNYNNKLMTETKRVEKVDEDDIFEYDVDGDLMSLSFD